MHPQIEVDELLEQVGAVCVDAVVDHPADDVLVLLRADGSAGYLAVEPQRFVAPSTGE
jgi:hypothetical protein